MIYPESLRPGDRIAIISPATTVKEEYIDGCVDVLRASGFDPVVMPSAKGPADGTFAASVEARVTDLKDALHDRSVKAILCARGGYGCVHLIPHFNDEEIRANAKWLIGFSDVSALHALWHRAGVASVHGPMAKHLTLLGADDPCTQALLSILTTGAGIDYATEPHSLDRQGEATGRLLGGNLAVLNGLAATDLDLLTGKDPDGVILFIEDIAEPVYKVERVLTRLYLSGALGRIRGLIVGQFTEYKPDRNHASMEEMISRLLDRYKISGIPVAFGFPVGHTDFNLPLIEGDNVTLTVGKDGVKLQSVPFTEPDNRAGKEITLSDAQNMVDEWIRTIGGRYFSELTNMVLLTEETGELARVVARLYGDQVAKEGDLRKGLKEEIADVLWVLTCIANQTDVDLTEAFLESLAKKTRRDKDRFR